VPGHYGNGMHSANSNVCNAFVLEPCQKIETEVKMKLTHIESQKKKEKKKEKRRSHIQAV
jgi:hypothetical protein